MNTSEVLDNNSSMVLKSYLGGKYKKFFLQLDFCGIYLYHMDIFMEKHITWKNACLNTNKKWTNFTINILFNVC